MDEGDKICGFDLMADESVLFYHRGMPDITPTQQKQSRIWELVFMALVGSYFIYSIFSGGADSFLSLPVPFLIAILALILAIRWLGPFVFNRLVRRKSKRWGQIAITNKRLLLRNLITGQKHDIPRGDIMSAKLDYAKGSRVVSLKTAAAPNTPIILEVADAMDAYAALNSD